MSGHGYDMTRIGEWGTQDNINLMRQQWQKYGTGPGPSGGTYDAHGGYHPNNPDGSGTAGGPSSQQTTLDKAGLSQIFLTGGYSAAIPRTQTDPNYAGNRAMLGEMLTGSGSRPAPQMQAAQINTAPQGQFRDQQMNLAQMLGASAAGQGPSAADAQLRQATDRNMSQALALALGARGGDQAAALKQAGMQRALIGQDAGLQSAQLRAQEQQAAQQALGAVLAQGRGADIGLATDQAGLTQAANQANLGAALQGQGLNDQRQLALLSGLLGLDQSNYQSGIQQGQFAGGLYNQAQGAANNVALQNNAQNIQLAGAGLNAGGALLGGAISALARPQSTSDEHAKEDVKPAEVPLGELLAAAGAHDYRYKEPDKPLRGHGRFVSPMAQELEQTEIGRSMVRDTPEGKIVDYGKGLGAMLSGLGWLHRRIEQIEKKYPWGDEPLGAVLARGKA